MQRDELNLPYNFDDPYYLESGYGLGYGNDQGWYYPDWSCPGGYQPGMGCGPNMGYDPNLGYDPNYGYGPGLGYNPGMGNGNYQWDYGCYQPGFNGGMAGMQELLQLARDTNQCCRQMLELLQSMQANQGHHKLSEE